MKVLIMGGNRFAGKLIVEQLYKGGHDLTVVNRTGTAPIDCKIIKCDRNNGPDLRRALGSRAFDCIVDMCLYNLQQAEISLPIFKDIAEKYIFISSVAVYQKSETFPIDETFPVGKWPLFGDYGIEKSKVEQYIASLEGISYVILRPTYVIGKNNHHNREGYYFDKITKGEPIDLENHGDAIVSFVFVEDLANIVVIFVNSDKGIKETYNICNDNYTTLKGFIDKISTTVNKPVTYNCVDKVVSFKNEHCFFSNVKIRNHVGYTFKTLEEGLAEIYEYNYKIP